MKDGFFKRLLQNLFVDKYNCIVCDEELEKPNKYGICPTCMSKLPSNEGKICLQCGKAMRDEANYCLTCQNNTFFFDIARSRYIYKDEVRSLIHKFKFGGAKYLAKYMAEYYVDMYKKFDYHADVVVSVPISKKREQQRGYNQAREIAIVVAKELALPYIENAVIKVKELRPQEELSSRERITSVVGAFKLNKPDAVKDKNILLIDDVLTTGATMSAVSMELKRKCGRIEALVFASPELSYKETHHSVEEIYSDTMVQD